MDTSDRDVWTLVVRTSALCAVASPSAASPSALPACAVTVACGTWRARELEGRRQKAAGTQNATIAAATIEV
eukprot:scaffold36048_cov59-Phaeocystis_antarctica.AAC.4